MLSLSGLTLCLDAQSSLSGFVLRALLCRLTGGLSDRPVLSPICFVLVALANVTWSAKYLQIV